MGLDTTHDCWNGSYGAFHRFRCKIAELVGIPLNLMETMFDHDRFIMFKKELGKNGSWMGDAFDEWLSGIPFKWEHFESDPICYLLHHSDCDGDILHKHCLPLANRLKELLPEIILSEDGGRIGNWKDTMTTFIDGLMKAHEAGEDVGFH